MIRILYKHQIFSRFTAAGVQRGIAAKIPHSTALAESPSVVSLALEKAARRLETCIAHTNTHTHTTHSYQQTRLTNSVQQSSMQQQSAFSLALTQRGGRCTSFVRSFSLAHTTRLSSFVWRTA